MHYDLAGTETPLIDDVVGLRFEFLGEATAPVLRVPVTDPVGPWTSYGPKPPALGVDVASDTWGAGENCTFQVDPATGLHVSRLRTLGPPGSLAPLTANELADGPWCPDAAHVNRYDADLHRGRQPEPEKSAVSKGVNVVPVIPPPPQQPPPPDPPP